MEATITKPQIKAIKTMQREYGIDAESLANGCSGMRTGKVSELTLAEGKRMIREMNKLVGRDPQPMRNKILALAYMRAGLGRNASKAEKQGVIVFVDGWCVKYGYLHKKLDEYSYDELPALVTQFERVIKSLVISI